MKASFGFPVVVILMISSCQPTQKPLQDPSALKSESGMTASDDTGMSAPTETFKGVVDGVAIIFSHTDYTRYRLSKGGVVTTGALNTERGFENDEDATVYILDYDKPERAQTYFVRLTDGDVVMLDAQRKVIPGAIFARGGANEE